MILLNEKQLAEVSGAKDGLCTCMLTGGMGYFVSDLPICINECCRGPAGVGYTFVNNDKWKTKIERYCSKDSKLAFRFGAMGISNS